MSFFIVSTRTDQTPTSYQRQSTTGPVMLLFRFLPWFQAFHPGLDGGVRNTLHPTYQGSPLLLSKAHPRSGGFAEWLLRAGPWPQAQRRPAGCCELHQHTHTRYQVSGIVLFASHPCSILLILNSRARPTLFWDLSFPKSLGEPALLSLQWHPQATHNRQPSTRTAMLQTSPGTAQMSRWNANPKHVPRQFFYYNTQVFMKDHT